MVFGTQVLVNVAVLPHKMLFIVPQKLVLFSF